MLFRLVMTVMALSAVVPAFAGSRAASGVSAPGGLLLVHSSHAGGAQATGTVNSVDVSKHSINVSHDPIRALKWPAMTMDFAVDPAVNLATIQPGMKVSFTVVRGDDGMYQVHELQPAGSK
jgi:Cu(I)/Ag(I) efflux system periplasmic protein CusF